MFQKEKIIWCELTLSQLIEKQISLAFRRNKILTSFFLLRLLQKAELKDIEAQLECVEMQILEKINKYPKMIAEIDRFNECSHT